MKGKLKKRIAAALCLLLCYMAAGTVLADTTAENELIIRAVATSYPEVDMGGRVALCAVILNRVENSGFPETVAGVIRGMDSGFDADKLYEPLDEKVYRITRDACMAARAGCDPTGGLLYFDQLPGPALGENRPAFEENRDLSGYRVVIGNLGFY